MTKIIDNYKLYELIGEGAYAKVYRSINTHDNQPYAVKVIQSKKLKQDKKLLQYIRNQVNILTNIQKNPHIIRFYEMIQTSNNFYLVYQYCNGGTLSQLLHRKKKLRQSQGLIILRQLLQAFKVLQRNHVMHRDLKPDNIFFQNEIVKLGDFGFCKNVAKTSVTNSILGSPIYMAPEVLKGLNYSNKADIWSIGVVLYQILYGYCPYQSSSINKLIQIIQTNELCFQDTLQISQTTKQLLKKLLTKDVKNRVDWQYLFQVKISETGQYIELPDTESNRIQCSLSFNNPEQIKLRKVFSRKQGIQKKDPQKLKKQMILARQKSPALLKRKTHTDKANKQEEDVIPHRMRKVNSVLEQTDDQSLKTKFFRKQTCNGNKRDSITKIQNDKDIPIVYVRPNSPVWKITDINKQAAITEHNNIINGLKIARIFSTATVRYSNLFAQILYYEVQHRLNELKNKLVGGNKIPQLKNLIDSQLLQIQFQSSKLKRTNETNSFLVETHKDNLNFLIKDKVKQSKDVKLCYELSCYLLKRTTQKITTIEMKEALQQLFI